LSKGFYLGLDMQPEGTDEYTVLGTGVSDRTTLLIKYNAQGVKGAISLDLRDEVGRRLLASAQTSRFAAKRLLFSVDPQQNIVRFYEANVVQDTGLLATTFELRERPTTFVDFANDFILGGASLDGLRIGSLSAKVANLFLGKGSMSEARADALMRASRVDVDAFNGDSIFDVVPSLERRRLFLDDVERLQGFIAKPTLSSMETRDCSVIMFRWLFDKHPLMLELSNELGIQLTLPGESEGRRNYHNVVAENAPLLMLPMTLGKRSALDFRWVSIRDFAADTAFIVNAHRVSVEALVKFVRHKLGGGHFDEHERARWQRDVVAMTDYARNDKNFMNHHMRELAIAVLESVYENRLEVHARANA